MAVSSTTAFRRYAPRGKLTRAAVVVAAIAAFAGVAAFLIAWSGVYDVAASKGHWRITSRLLAFAMRNSVETQSRSIEVPALDEPILVQLGISHYAGACTPCHGAPGERRNPVPLGAVPMPPFLPDVIDQWSPAEIFWIVKHGIKYTSMPAWPSQVRDDEVWAIVAATVRLDELEPAEYRRLAHGKAFLDVARAEEDARQISVLGAAGADLVACARCHGLRGGGREPDAFPRLAGQSQEYLFESMRSYALGVRPSGIMQPIAAELTDGQMRELSRYFASLSIVVPPRDEGEDRGRIGRGRAIALDGAPAAAVPACAPCHGPTAAQLHPVYPKLSGQPRFYLEQQLRLWREGVRQATPFERIMTEAARFLEDEHIADVAAYYAAGADLEDEADLRRRAGASRDVTPGLTPGAESARP